MNSSVTSGRLPGSCDDLERDLGSAVRPWSVRSSTIGDCRRADVAAYRRVMGTERGTAATVLGMPRADRLVIFLGIPAVGLLIGLALPPLARWLLGLEAGPPMRALVRVVGAVDRPWEIAVNLAIWLVLALVVLASALSESARLTVTDTELRLDRGDWTRTIARADIDAAFAQDRRLVLLDRESRHLVREPTQAPLDAVARELRARGYPWRDEDPYAGLYRRWWTDTPELPEAVNRILTARELALKRKAADEVRELADAVQRLGFAVREEGPKQYWRPLVRS
jgi:hypothetical protein